MRWRRVTAAVGVVAVLTAPLWGPRALRPFSFFRVRRVELVGVRYLSPQAVSAALALRREASVWDPLGPLARRVSELPGVAEATVTRRLPGALRVRIREVEPVALAQGRDGLVPLGADARPLPFDPARIEVDVPVVEGAGASIVGALAAIQATDPTFFSGIASARPGPAGSLELDLAGHGLVRLGLPVDPVVVQAVAAVERDLASGSRPWRELDGRFARWVVVRRPTRGEVKS